ncbi:MAG TPA: carboxypeptidase regulatory-like domain-containing protein [Blastocatellia bacterium]|nr:carboxypeptidase regulatory-like domain-containing protein [Blastocatellia bacterium]
MRFVWCLLAVFIVAPLALAQSVSLRGQVADQNGAVIPKAKVTLNGPSSLVKTSTADDRGGYSFTELAPGDYSVTASAPNLALPEPVKITLKSGVHTLNLQLSVVIAEQKVNVQENTAPAVTTDSSNNASAVVLRGDDLKALGDSEEDLQADLLALAGPSAGPGGGAIFIDGFSGGQLPSKESIREIRINQNPFSPEYDKLGLGRIEIFTKPGTDKFRGTLFYNFAHHFWNSRNPYAQEKAPFLLQEYGGNLSGPLNKRSSFFLDVRRDEVDNGSIINAITLDPQTLGVVNPFTDTPKAPQRRISVNPRLDYQLNDRNTLTLRYVYTHIDVRDAGLGGFNLTSRGYHVLGDNQTVQLTETAVLSASVINETRFQFIHASGETIANTLAPAIQVLGSFNGGGAQVGHSFNGQNNYEFQNYTSVARKSHYWKFGVRLRGETVDNTSPQNFGGTFTFGGGDAPVLDSNSQPVLDSSGKVVSAPITSIERYRRTLLFQKLGFTPSRIRELGGGATQFSVSAGNPALSASQFDVGLFVGDDWRVRPNLTLSLGLRYETQTNIHDWRDVAPRVGVAWAPGAGGKNSRPKTVIRAGFGVFYDRFLLSNTLTALRYNGVVQRQFVVANPDFFPTIPALSSLAGFQLTQTIQQVSATLRAPYIMQSAVSFERQLPFNTTVAVTYANSHGLHLLRSQDINAPLPGTYDPLIPGSGVFPLGDPGPVFQMESAGRYNQHQLIANVNARINKDVSLTGSYVFNRVMSDTDGLGTFPAKPYDFAGEYGPAATDVRHRFSLNGSFNTKWNVRLSPFVILDSGPPFDITVGRDLYGTTLFNGRPGIPNDPNKPGLIRTGYGLLDPNPTSGERILPRNFGRGPGSVTVNLRLTKTIEFGGERGSASTAQRGPGGGEGRPAPGVFSTGAGTPGSSPSAQAGRRYNLSISMSVRNLLNHTNPGPIIGNITSPLFGQANQPAGGAGFVFSEAANNRRLELQMRFTF